MSWLLSSDATTITKINTAKKFVKSVKSKYHSPSSSRPIIHLSNSMYSYSLIPPVFQVPSILSQQSTFHPFEFPVMLMFFFISWNINHFPSIYYESSSSAELSDPKAMTVSILCWEVLSLCNLRLPWKYLPFFRKYSKLFVCLLCWTMSSLKTDTESFIYISLATFHI